MKVVITCKTGKIEIMSVVSLLPIKSCSNVTQSFIHNSIKKYFQYQVCLPRPPSWPDRNRKVEKVRLIEQPLILPTDKSMNDITD